MFEVWKDVVGYEGLYQVSNLGKVRSLNWRNQGIIKEMYLKHHKQGYLQVELYYNGNRKMFTVHRLVAFAFVDGYKDGFVVNHKDEDKRNNAASNLEWCSFSTNVRYSIAPHGRGVSRVKGKPRTCHEKVLQRSLSGDVVTSWESVIQVKSSLGFNEWAVRECCRGNRNTAYGYKWEYTT